MDIYKLFFDPERTEPVSGEDLGENPIPHSKFDVESDPAGYEADPELAAAVNVALLAGKPLLLTGEPGVGKTQLAFRLAWEFQMPIHPFEVKSTTRSSDLFYYFDMIGYFRSAQIKQDIPPKNFIRYNALGRAILESTGMAGYQDILREGHELTGPRRSIVLIDEIDKAPRDFPNDILNELERLFFRIPELDNRRIDANPQLAPIVIMTSNSEKNLPDAFMRRCIFHHINFPEDQETLLKILNNRIKGFQKESPLTKQLIEIFSQIRERDEVSKLPSTGELIQWVDVLKNLNGDNYNTTVSKEKLRLSWGVLLKNQDDIQLAKLLMENGELGQPG